MSSLANTNAVRNRETTPVAGSHRMRYAMVHEAVQEVCPIWCRFCTSAADGHNRLVRSSLVSGGGGGGRVGGCLLHCDPVSGQRSAVSGQRSAVSGQRPAPSACRLPLA